MYGQRRGLVPHPPCRETIRPRGSPTFFFPSSSSELSLHFALKQPVHPIPSGIGLFLPRSSGRPPSLIRVNHLGLDHQHDVVLSCGRQPSEPFVWHGVHLPSDGREGATATLCITNGVVECLVIFGFRDVGRQCRLPHGCCGIGVCRLPVLSLRQRVSQLSATAG